MKFNNQFIKQNTLLLVGIGLATSILLSNPQFVAFLFRIANAFNPILIAFLIAFFMQPLILKVKKIFYTNTAKGHKKAVLSSYILIWILFYLFARWFSSPLLYDLQAFIENISSRSFIVNLSEKIDSTFSISSYQYLVDAVNDLSIWFNKNIRQLAINTFNKTLTLSFKMLFIIAAAVYISIDFDKLKAVVHRKIKTKNKKSVKTLEEIGVGLKAWSKGWLKDQAFIFVCTLIFFWILGIESFFTLAVIMTLFNFVPFFGPIIGGALIWLYIIATYVNITGSTILFGTLYIQSNVTIIIALIGIITIQTIESLWWIPRVYSNEVDIKPLTTLLSVSVIATIFSPLFAPFTIPIIVIVKTIYKNNIKK